MNEPRRSGKWRVGSLGTAALALLITTAGAGSANALPPVAMRIVGHGPVVVFESGMGETQGSWRTVATALACCLTVVTYDRPGIGGSPVNSPIKPVLAAKVADDLLLQLRAHHLSPPFILVGHSIGGLYVQAFARNHPSAVAGLVLVDASSPLEPPGVFVSTVAPKPGTVEAAEEAGVAPSTAALLAGPALPPVPLVVIAATNHGDTLKRESMWQDVQRRTAALSPKGKLIIVNSGHFVQTQRPATVIDAVLTVAAESGTNVAACRERTRGAGREKPSTAESSPDSP
ncbi:MAG: alpha/beta fold hydrolase [Candidatus Binataceae bacterium]